MAYKENIKRKRQNKNKNIEWINELTFGHIARFWVPTISADDPENFKVGIDGYEYYWDYFGNGQDEDIIYGRFCTELNKNITSKPLLERFGDFIESNKGVEDEGYDYYTEYCLIIEVSWNVCGDKTWSVCTGWIDEDGPELTDDECQLLISMAYEKFKPEFDNFKKNNKDIWNLMNDGYFYLYEDAIEEIKEKEEG